MLTIYNKKNNCAGFIYEPLVQGAAGMVMYEPESLDKLMQICKENGVLTIADEVMTGFGNRKNICDRLFGRKTRHDVLV
jgi:adenosylmethionine-8-amino-7-oxononanoate aminotransferase